MSYKEMLRLFNLDQLEVTAMTSVAVCSFNSADDGKCCFTFVICQTSLADEQCVFAVVCFV